jgi:hypothetical protein
MVGTGQIVSLIFLAAGVYIAIEYGPDIIKWAQGGIAKIKDQASKSQDTSTPPSQDSGSVPFTPPPEDMSKGMMQVGKEMDKNTPTTPQSKARISSDGVYTPLNQPPLDLSQAVPQPKQSNKNNQKQNKRGRQDLTLSGGTAPVKQAPKTKAVTPTNFEDFNKPKPVTPTNWEDFNRPKPKPTAPKPIPLSTRFPKGTRERGIIDSNFGCHCAGTTCRLTATKCNGAPATIYNTVKSANAAAWDKGCTALRAQFTKQFGCKAQAGYAFGDRGQLISLESMNVSIA